MAKIENTTVYPLTTPWASDYLIGTDSSDNNRTVSFSISDITAAGGLQDLESVLSQGNIATNNISLTGNIVCTDIYPTTLTAAGTPGAAGQILSSTAVGLEWVNLPTISCCALEDVLLVGADTGGTDITTTGGILMSGAAGDLDLSGGADITLALNSSITTQDDVYLSGSASTLNFGATAGINDSDGGDGVAGYVLTVKAGGSGVKWEKLPAESTPTLQEVLNSGNTADAIGISFTGIGTATFYSSYGIASHASNVWFGNNGFSKNGATIGTSAINLTGSLSDGVSTGTAGQVLTSTATGVSWADETIGSQNLQQVLTEGNTSTLNIITTGYIQPHQISDGSSIGTPGQILSATTGPSGLAWISAPVSTVTFNNSPQTISTGSPLTISPTTGAVVVRSNYFSGAGLIGHVPSSASSDQTTTFLRADGSWVVPAGGGGGSAPSGFMSHLLCAAKTAFVASNYYTLTSNNTPSSKDRTVFTTDLGASDPATMAGTMTDIQHVAGCFLSNPTGDLCGSAYPKMKICDMDFQFIADAAAATHTWVIQLWKTSRCASLSYTLAGTATFTAVSADTIYCRSIVWVSTALQTLDPAEAFFITAQPDGTIAAGDFQLNTSIRWEGVA